MITPFRCGVDTLEATFDGGLAREFVEDLARRKEEAIRTGETNEVRLGGRLLHLGPKGSGVWPYSMRNDEMIISLGTAANIPTMKVHLLALGLAQNGLPKLWSQVKAIADELELEFFNCTRVDIALDYHGDFVTFEDSLNLVCRSSFRPIYPNTTNPETYQIGKGDMTVRVYRKSVEIAAKGHEWWVFVWRLCEGYCEDEAVNRVEVQMRGKVLRELGYRSVEQLMDGLPELFAYGLEWCSLRIPNGDSNKSRWPEDPRWTLLRTAFNPSRTLGRTRPLAAYIDYDRAVGRCVSLAVSAGAARNSTDFAEVTEALFIDAEQRIERTMQTDFKSLVEKKRKRRHL